MYVCVVCDFWLLSSKFCFCGLVYGALLDEIALARACAVRASVHSFACFLSLRERMLPRTAYAMNTTVDLPHFLFQPRGTGTGKAY